jgi:hypothetical protein
MALWTGYLDNPQIHTVAVVIAPGLRRERQQHLQTSLGGANSDLTRRGRVCDDADTYVRNILSWDLVDQEPVVRSGLGGARRRRTSAEAARSSDSDGRSLDQLSIGFRKKSDTSARSSSRSVCAARAACVCSTVVVCLQ